MLVVAMCACSVTKTPQMTAMTLHGMLMMDEYPIRVIEYREFLYYQSTDSKKMLVPADSEARFYLNDPHNLEKPVRGINAEQALAYCQWRSQVWNQKGDGHRYRFRLPTVEEMRESDVDFGAGFLSRELAVADEGVIAYGEGFESPDVATKKGDAVGFRCMAEVVPL